MKLSGALLFTTVLAVTLACGDGRIKKHNDPPPIPDPTCGDGHVDEGEECDGSDLNGQSCTTLGFDLGTVSCDASCKIVTSQCTKLCGDGKIGLGEECDGTQGPLACGDWGYKACTSACKVEGIHCKSTSFDEGTPLTLTPGGHSLLTDLAPAGYGDLVTAVPDRSNLKTSSYDATKGFSGGRTISPSGSTIRQPLLPIAGDLDGDGNIDLAAINTDGTVDRYRYTPPNPTEHFVFEPLFPGAASDAGATCRIDQWVGVGELDGAAGQDLVALGCPGTTGTSTYDALFVIPGGATPVPARELDHAGMLAATVADFDGDGTLDLIALDKTQQVIVFKGPELTEQAPIDFGDSGSNVGAADFDGDGDADLVVASGANVNVYENLGAAFAKKQTFAGTGFELLVRDLDLDGQPDIAWLESGKVELRRSLGSFVFSEFSISIGAGTPVSLSAGDVEGDGDPDLAATVQPSPGSNNTVTHVLLNEVR